MLVAEVTREMTTVSGKISLGTGGVCLWMQWAVLCVAFQLVVKSSPPQGHVGRATVAALGLDTVCMCRVNAGRLMGVFERVSKMLVVKVTREGTTVLGRISFGTDGMCF